MCGIFGYLGDFSSTCLHSANQIQRHRGPDDQGIWFDGSVGLAHVRLSVIDTSSFGFQPMVSQDGRWKLVYNGEIYNFKELRNQLVESGHFFRGYSDTEVLLALWQKHGETCLHMLNGMFAFAIWDSWSSQLTVVRDRSGIKPLFWSQLPDGFVFASEVKNLTPLCSIHYGLLSDQLLRQLTYLWCPGPATLNPLIHSLEPGCLLRCRVSEPPVLLRWCNPIPMSRPVINNSVLAISTMKSTLRKAVRRQMVSDVPLGAFLSGGLDSSSVVAFASEYNSKLQCFTLVNPGLPEAGFQDDLPYARRVAHHLNVALHEVEIHSGDLASDLLWMLDQLDAPVADPAPLNVFHICRASRRLGIKVLLSGTAGDDLFTGYRRHFALQSESFWGWWPRFARRLLRRGSARLSHFSSLGRRLARTFELADADPQQRLFHYFRWGTPETLIHLLSDPMQQQLQDLTAQDPFRDYLASLPRGLSRLQQMLALEQRFFLADHNLHYTDSMSMAAGVEVRVPFLDPELLAFSWRLPDRFKQRGRCGKWVLKQAMSDLLPHDVIYRSKTGFGAPLRRWLLHDLRSLVEETLSSDRLAADGLFNPLAVHSLLDDQLSGRRDATYTIWSMLCITLWWDRQRSFSYG